MRKYIILVILSVIVISCTKPAYDSSKIKTGNVIFFHPDGTGLAMWHAARMLNYGPDGELNWDKMPNMAIYKGHTKNSLTSSSHAGATIHAYGVKVIRDSYGLDGKDTITARSGNKKTIMEEAREAGMLTAIVNTGSIIEPGTGCFVSRSEKRGNYEAITKEIVQSGTDIIMSGGEEWMLPEGVEGKYCTGKRTDGLNLIKWAEDKGYKVVYNKDELKALPVSTAKVLGVFAKKHTFNDMPEEDLKKEGLPLYWDYAPTVAEMTDAALKILKAKNKQFFLVVEEEATDNFPNDNNAIGLFEALKRTDETIGIVQEFIKNDPNTMLIMAADSEASGMEIVGYPDHLLKPDENLPATDKNGAPLDGVDGPETKPFMAKADKNGKEMPFAVAWSSFHDVSGAVIAKAEGLNSELVKGTIDNIDIYKYMYATLFGKLVK